MTLIERLTAKIAGPNDQGCALWTAGVSRGGRREVDYGALRERGKHGPMWRAHRLVLLLATAPVDVPRDENEDFFDWLSRARRHYTHLDAAHACDVSRCCTREHLDWKDHAANIKEQKGRRATHTRDVTSP